jgi:hypothetical protein
MSNTNADRFRGLTFDRFKDLARDNSLSPYEKIGFPDEYRDGKEDLIFRDIRTKLGALNDKNRLILDIGPGCSGLAFRMIDLCREQEHRLLLVDSQEMLDHLPDEPFITKVAAKYPRECLWLFEKYAGQVDALLTYSVLQYVFVEGNLYEFLDRSLSLLAEGGAMLIGDIPNVSKRKRFFASANGIRFHRQYSGKDEIPPVVFNQPEAEQMDDAVLMSCILRSRSAGFDCYWLPQADDLPMANRREDLLIRRP